ncbi:MAG TPA: hypothetical protein VKA48_12835 [Gammaproteobacteria bacterium]|nr:hypothetical protein [Gammaproteobacteria bacterium]
MRPVRIPFRLFLAALLLAGTAASQAGPVAGPSIFGGLAFHESKYSDAPHADGYSSHGANIGVDYQIPINRMFSWNPFYALSLENSKDLAQEPSVRNSILGLEARAWYRTMFLGAHLGLYRQVVDGDTYRREGTGLGWGFSLGVQGPGNLYTVGMLTRAKRLGVWRHHDVDVTGLRLRIGYRFR